MSFGFLNAKPPPAAAKANDPEEEPASWLTSSEAEDGV